jgi:ABC-type sugar transport system substrate-binding protein
MLVALAATLTLASGLLVACGDDDDAAAGSTAAATGAGDDAAAKAARATDAGTAAGEAAGDPVKVPHITLGYLDQVGSAEIAQRTYGATKTAAESLGWDVAYCDAAGDPRKMASCGDSLLDRHVDVMLSTAIDSSLIKPQLKKAQSADVPWITIEGGARPDPLFTAQVAPDEVAIAEVINDYLVEQLGTIDGPAPIGIHTFTQIYAVAQREDALKRQIEGTNIEIADTHQTDLANGVEDTTRAAETQIQGNPDLKALWGDINFHIPGFAIAMQRHFAGKSFPDRPLVVGFFGDRLNLQQIRSGLADAVVEAPLEANGWIVVDQIAENLARGTEIEDGMQPGYYELDFVSPSLITKDNLPPEDQLVEPEEDFAKFFATKWATEFTNVPAAG